MILLFYHRGKLSFFSLLSLFLPLKQNQCICALELLLWPALELCHIYLGIVIFRIKLTHGITMLLHCVASAGVKSTPLLDYCTLRCTALQYLIYLIIKGA